MPPIKFRERLTKFMISISLSEKFCCQNLITSIKVGKSFTLITDAKPLTHIVGLQASPTSKRQSLRLEQWRLQLVTYDFKICYKQGDENYADYLSRHLNSSPPTTNYAEDYVNFVAAHSMPNALTLSDIATATKEDKILQNMIMAMKTNNWNNKLCQNVKTYSAYSKLSHELTVLEVDGREIILRGTRLAVTETSQKHCIDLAHNRQLHNVKHVVQSTLQNM